MHERFTSQRELPEPSTLAASVYALLQRRSHESQRLKGRYEIQLGDFTGSGWERQRYGALFVLHTLSVDYALSKNMQIYEIPDDVNETLAVQSMDICAAVVSARDPQGRLRRETQIEFYKEYVASGIEDPRVELAARLVEGLRDHAAQPVAEDAYAALCHAAANGAFAEPGTSAS